MERIKILRKKIKAKYMNFLYSLSLIWENKMQKLRNIKSYSKRKTLKFNKSLKNNQMNFKW